MNNRLQYGHELDVYAERIIAMVDRTTAEADAADADAVREMEARIRRIRELRASRFQAADNQLFSQPDVADARAMGFFTDRDEE